MKLLVIAAHPDDEVLGAGGSIARAAARGDEVQIAILGQGLGARVRGADVPRGELDRLREQAHAAAEMLGARPPRCFDLPDNRFDSLPLLEIVQLVEELVRDLRPEVVWTHSGGDLNRDHELCARAVQTALRPMQGSTVRALECFEVPSSTEWAFGQFSPVFRPDRFRGIEAALERKLEALRLYESESRDFPHPRSPEAVRALARVRGAQVGLVAAEAFQTLWSVEA